MRYPVSFLLVVLLSRLRAVLSASSAPVVLKISNESGVKIAISWVNPVSRETLPMRVLEITDHQVPSINSYMGHEFEVRELPFDESTGACQSEDKSCKTEYFTITQAPEQHFLFKTGLQIEEKELEPDFEDTVLEAPELLAKCKEEAKEQLEEANNNPDEIARVMKKFNTCLRFGLASKLKQASDEVFFQKELREEASMHMENFTCIDTDMESTPDVITEEWISEKDSVARIVHVKLDRPASRIHVVENFASPEECAAVEESASNKLHRASTADGKGGTTLSPARKAMQAGISPKWGKEAGGDLVAALSRRVYDYVNRVLDLDITEHGQEPLMSIQYFGKGYNDTEPDRYTPHCDGKCEGLPHTDGARMATMVIYCTIPDKGGHTNFQNAAVHIKPEVGNGIFFSYIDPQNNVTDSGLTQHSGCPVYEGEKKIITQWVRYGVGPDRQHTHFNTLGILRSEDGE